MSARTEQLVEQIHLLEQRLASGSLDATTSIMISEELKQLRKQLSSASDALTEGKQILKG